MRRHSNQPSSPRTDHQFLHHVITAGKIKSPHSWYCINKNPTDRRHLSERNDILLHGKISFPLRFTPNPTPANTGVSPKWREQNCALRKMYEKLDKHDTDCFGSSKMRIYCSLRCESGYRSCSSKSQCGPRRNGFALLGRGVVAGSSVGSGNEV